MAEDYRRALGGLKGRLEERLTEPDVSPGISNLYGSVCDLERTFEELDLSGSMTGQSGLVCATFLSMAKMLVGSSAYILDLDQCILDLKALVGVQKETISKLQEDIHEWCRWEDLRNFLEWVKVLQLKLNRKVNKSKTYGVFIDELDEELREDPLSHWNKPFHQQMEPKLPSTVSRDVWDWSFSLHPPDSESGRIFTITAASVHAKHAEDVEKVRDAKGLSEPEKRKLISIMDTVVSLYPAPAPAPAVAAWAPRRITRARKRRRLTL